MRIFVLALALLPVPAVARDGDKNPSAKADAPATKCQDAKTQYAGSEPAKAVHPRTLAQEPLANQYHPVLRRENGCDVPVKIREDVGRVQR